MRAVGPQVPMSFLCLSPDARLFLFLVLVILIIQRRLMPVITKSYAFVIPR